MGLATQHGLFSIVEKTPGEFHVRARCRADSENPVTLAGLTHPEVDPGI